MEKQITQSIFTYRVNWELFKGLLALNLILLKYPRAKVECLWAISLTRRMTV